MPYPSSWVDLFDRLVVQDAQIKEKLDKILGANDLAARFKFNAEIQRQLDRARERNESLARELCRKVLDAKTGWILAKYRAGVYHVASAGLPDLHKDLESAKAAYDKAPELQRIRFHAGKERKAFWNKEVRDASSFNI